MGMSVVDSGNKPALVGEYEMKDHLLTNLQPYKTLFEHYPDAVYVLDPAENFIWVNQAAVELIGYRLEECVNKAFLPSISDEVIEKARDHFQKALQGETQSYEVVIRNRAGQLRVTHTSNVPVIIDGEVVCVYVVARDITESKQAEEQLRKSEKSLMEAQRMAQLGSWEWDVRENIIFPTEELCRIFGTTPEGMNTIGKFMARIHEEDREFVHQSVQAALAGSSYNIEFRICRENDDAMRVIHAYGEVIFDEQGQPVRMIGLDHDITERKEKERQLLASEERYRMITEHSLDLITIHTLVEINILFASPACRTLLGYEPEELVGVSAYNLIHPDDIATIQEYHRQTLEGHYVHTFEYRIRRKTGEYIWFETTGKMIEDGYSSLQQIVCVSRDITARKQLEEDRQNTEQLLLKSEKLSIAGQLAAGIAHEIRNPLTAIKGFLQLMKHDDKSNERYIDIMFAEMDRIEMILGELLVLAKPQVDVHVDQDLQTIVLDVVTLIYPQALMHNIEIVTRVTGRALQVACDGNQLKQVFINFLKNAIEAMPQGGVITIELGVHDQDQLRVRFIDEGCGIPEERLARLCEPFYTTKEKGTGLGLMVSKKIIENHRGLMEVSSRVGVGTTVDVYLPLGGTR